MSALVVGPGTRSGIDIGPLIDAAGRAKVEELVADALQRGARNLVGGHTPRGPGHFHPPTVLTEVHPGSRHEHRDLRPRRRGPHPRRQGQSPAARQRHARGLVGYVFTQGLDRGLRVSERLEVGMVGLNTGRVSDPAAPFGGIKQPGLGREGAASGSTSCWSTSTSGCPCDDGVSALTQGPHASAISPRRVSIPSERPCRAHELPSA